MVAIALVVILAAGLFETGRMVSRMTHFNRIALESRALGSELVEEVSARTVPEIIAQMPFAPLTNRLQFGEQVVRSVTIVGHAADQSVVTNLAQSAYLELHVNVVFTSPLTQSPVTNLFSTLVN